jgi:hypothetical protein
MIDRYSESRRGEITEALAALNDVDEMDSDSLLTAWSEARDLVIPLRERMERIEYRLRRAMEDDGATEFGNGNATATLRPSSTTYDADVLDGVNEYINPTELQEAGAVVPAHTVEVERRYNMTKLKPFGKRHRDVRATIEEARVLGPSRLTIARAK